MFELLNGVVKFEMQRIFSQVYLDTRTKPNCSLAPPGGERAGARGFEF
jgi:hypothetical protein